MKYVGIKTISLKYHIIMTIVSIIKILESTVNVCTFGSVHVFCSFRLEYYALMEIVRRNARKNEKVK